MPEHSNYTVAVNKSKYQLFQACRFILLIFKIYIDSGHCQLNCLQCLGNSVTSLNWNLDTTALKHSILLPQI